MPCNYKEYPPEWREIVARKKAKHHDKCEICHAPNHQIVYRYGPRAPYPWYLEPQQIVVALDAPGRQLDMMVGNEESMMFLRESKTKIVLTVHHIDSNKSNNNDRNLLLSCQRCHLRLDIEKHIRKRAENRRGR